MTKGMDIWEDKYGAPLEDGCTVWVELDGGFTLEDIVKYGMPETRYDGAQIWTELEGPCPEDSQMKVVLTRHVVKR